MVRHKLTGANYGLSAWLQQRITAIIMLAVAVVFLGFILVMAVKIDANIASWQAVFNCTVVKIIVQLFFAAMLLHAWVGMRDLWMDYIQCTAVRVTLHSLTLLWLLASLIYSIKVIWA